MFKQIILAFCITLAALHASEKCFASDLPFGLSMGMAEADIPALSKRPTALSSTQSIMGSGTNCVDHFLAGGSYPSSDSKKFKESVSEYIKRVDVFPDLNAKLYEVDVAGSDSTYRKVCFGFVKGQLVFLQIPTSSISDNKGVEAAIASKFQEKKRQQDMQFPASEIVWENADVIVTWTAANPLHRFYALTGRDLGSNRLRYARKGYAEALRSQLVALHEVKSPKVEPKKEF